MKFQSKTVWQFSWRLTGLLAFVVSAYWISTAGLSAGQSNLALRPTAAQAAAAFATVPLGFEANHGQLPAPIRFFARGQDYGLFLNADEAVLQLRGTANSQTTSTTTTRPAPTISLRWLSGQPAHSIEPLEALPGRSNYFVGNDPTRWRTDVPNFARVRYNQIYPGVDLIFYGQQRQLEYDLVIAPNAAPEQIRLSFAGATRLELAENGDLLLHTDAGTVRQPRPQAYQQTAQGRVAVAAEFILTQQLVSFRLGAYDHNLPLVIDPLLLYASYLGGNNTDVAFGIAVDREGSIYLTGQTFSPNFPVKAPVDTALDGANDAFITKLNPAGTQVLFSTFIGGRGSNDRGWAVAVDAAGNVYFVGETNSLNFPTANAAQPVPRGNGDGFAVKLNIAGNVLLYSTFLGGGLSDVAFAVALDRFDNAYITGRTDSTNFPVKNALQPALRGQRDAFVLRLDPDGVLVASTYLGGPPATSGGLDDEAAYGIAVDRAANVFVVGVTTTPLFPTVNAVQATFGGVEDAFVAKLNLTAGQVVFSTFLGGQRADAARGVAVDTFGNIYVTGFTISADFPLKNALQPTYGTASDAFLTKLSAKGTSFIYSTYLGGSGEENTSLASDSTPLGSLAVDTLGYVYLTGKTQSTNFPTVRAIQEQKRGDNDAFIAKVDPAGAALVYSTYFGSSFVGNNGFEERGLAIALDTNNTAYVTGQVLGTDLSTVLPLQRNYGGGLSDGFVVKVSTPDIVAAAPLSAASFTGGQFAPESIIALFGPNLAPNVETASTLPLPTLLQGTSVKVTDRNGTERAAPLFFVSPTQINFQLPGGTAAGPVKLSVVPAVGEPITAMVQVEAVAPSLFTANATGQGLAAGVALRIKSDGTQSFAPVAQFDPFLQRFIAAPIDLGSAADQNFLLLFGTGLRGHSGLNSVTVRINDIPVQPQFVGAQGSLVGLDQLNIPLPYSLAGRGEVTIEISVDGWLANPVTISLK